MDLLNKDYQHALTTMDCFKDVYPCILYGGTWNGWQEPYMTKENAIKVLAEIKTTVTDEESDQEIVKDFQWIVDNFGKGVFRLIDGIEYADMSMGCCWDSVESSHLDNKGNKLH